MKMLTIIILVVLNTVTALGVVHNQYKKRVYGMQMSEIEAGRDHMVDKWAQLLVEYASWSTNSRIEEIARQQLNMKYEFGNYSYLEI